MIRASAQSARSRTLPRSPKSATRIRILPPARSMSSGLGRIAVGHGGGLESFLAVDEHAEDDASQRPGPLVDANDRLESPISGLDADRRGRSGSACRSRGRRPVRPAGSGGHRRSDRADRDASARCTTCIVARRPSARRGRRPSSIRAWSRASSLAGTGSPRRTASSPRRSPRSAGSR